MTPDDYILTREEPMNGPLGSDESQCRKFRFIGKHNEVVIYRSYPHLIPGWVEDGGWMERLLPRNWIA